MNYQNPHGSSCPWYSLTESQGAPNIKWCEETLCQWISEPANTWSNLGYLIIALLITYLSFKNKHNLKLKQFGPIVFFMGFMSLFYHLSNFYGSQVLDFLGMFLFVGWVIGMNLIRLNKLEEAKLLPFNTLLSLVLTIFMHLMYLMEIKFQGLILLSGILIVIMEVLAYKKQKISIKWFVLSLFLIVLAFGFSLADGTRYWCDPHEHGIFSQGHALWHWIASVAMLTIYLHYSQAALKPRQD